MTARSAIADRRRQRGLREQSGPDVELDILIAEFPEGRQIGKTRDAFRAPIRQHAHLAVIDLLLQRARRRRQRLHRAAQQRVQRRTGAALTLAAHSAWLSVLPDDACARLSIDRREFADLFADGTPHEETRTLLRGYDRIESWTGHGDERFADRLRSISGATVAVHPFRTLRPGEHACDYFERCLGVTPRRERLPVRPAAARWPA